MTNIKTNTITTARRGLDNTSSMILHEIYLAYPEEVSFKALEKKLQVVEKTIQSSLKTINRYGVPIEYKINQKKEKILRANIKEPISWILKEKIAAENMLCLFENNNFDGDDIIKNQKTINRRIYTEYLDSLNELFDKWSSLRLIEKLDEII